LVETPTTDANGLQRARLDRLAEYEILDTPNEEAFDRVARLISQIFGVDIGIVSMIDGHRQWYKAAEGMAAREMQLADAFCRYTIEGDRPLIVTDASSDARFAGNPNVTGDLAVRFYAGVPLRTRDGLNLGTICAIDPKPRAFGDKDIAILEDLARMVMRDLELSKQVAVDEMTGAMARHAFLAEARRHLALANRKGEQATVVVFDLDHFKAINDGRGHATGDRTLASVGTEVMRHLRTSDLFGRIGGEEFAAFLPSTDVDGGRLVAEKLREALATLTGKLGFAVSASFGVATSGGNYDDLEAMLDRADQAMYSAKRNGRNQVMTEQAHLPQPTAPRRRVLKAGKIRYLNQLSLLDCTVRSIGDDGATIAVSSPIGIPDDFVLAIPGDHLEKPCHVTGRSERALEVRFKAA
jgi:diguanylate cyclase (GGDEF)-like protein